MVVINFCSFYSEGPPNDEANNYSDLVPEILKNANGHFNNINFYTPNKLRELGYSKYLKTHELYEKSKLWSPIEKIGLSAFRPAMLLHELSKMNDGDILVYRDINWKKYPTYRNFDEFPELAEKILSQCQFDFYVSSDTPRSVNIKLNNFTKSKVIRELGENAEIFKHVNTFHANMFVIRKSKISIDLLTEWQTAMENDDWLNGDISDEPDQNILFHAIDQSILSVIIYNWIRKRKHNIPLKYPFIEIDVYHTGKIINISEQFYEYLKYLT